MSKGARINLENDSTSLLGLAMGWALEHNQTLPGQRRQATEAQLQDLRAVCETLLNAGARTHLNEKRLLLLAVETEDPELVSLALRHGEAPDLPDEAAPPLREAVRTSVRATELLLEAGADPNKRGTLSGMPGKVASAFDVAQEQASGAGAGWNSRDPRVHGRPFFFLGQAERTQIFDLVVKKNGRAFVSTENSIAFATDITNSLRISPIFSRTPVSLDREFSLAEMLDRVLLRSLEPGQQDRTVMPWYPDLSGAYIYNDLDRRQPPIKKPVDLRAMLEVDDFGKNLRLEWGDILVIPKKSPRGDEEPYVLPASKASALKLAIRKEIHLSIVGESPVALTFEQGAIVLPEGTGVGASSGGSFPTVGTLARWSASRGYRKFHGRFRIVRPHQPVPLDRVFLFDASFGSRPTSGIPIGVNLPPPIPGQPVSSPAAAAGLVVPALGVSSNDEFPNGDLFVLQDGDIVTLYPLPKP